jgi:branched-subunit amino acid transport protein AzlD
MSGLYIYLVIITSAAATFLTRALPFLLFERRTKSSPFLGYIHRNMPLMIMVALVFYAIRETEWGAYPYGASEIIGIAAAAALHLAFKNALLSIIVSTALYMFLIQVVFA